jgi:hypothetical protein
VGPGAAFDGTEGVRLQDFADGTSDTFLIVEAGSAVPWTCPTDLAYAPDRPLPELGGIFKGTFRAALADGSVEQMPQQLSETTLRAFVTRSAGDTPRRDWQR